jgi:hypothetical protein
MWGEVTLRIKQHGEYQIFAINDSGESIKNHEYFLELEAKFESLQISREGLGRSPFVKKSETQNLVGLSPKLSFICNK